MVCNWPGDNLSAAFGFLRDWNETLVGNSRVEHFGTNGWRDILWLVRLSGQPGKLSIDHFLGKLVALGFTVLAAFG
ncbi:MAG: hypothetical protein Kow0088_06760 [Anaerolineales bacterium]